MPLPITMPLPIPEKDKEDDDTIGVIIETADVEFDADKLPTMLKIATEYLSISKPDVQTVAAHAMGVGKAITDDEFQDIYDKMIEALAHVKANAERAQALFMEIQEMVEETKVKTTKLDTDKDDYAEFIKTMKLKGIPIAYKIGAVVAFVTPTIIAILSASSV